MANILPLNDGPSGEPITLNEWFSLITLCLVPLVTHIVVAIPTIVCLQAKRPRWHDKIGLYNPTSILWHYFAIADRRIRSKDWEPYDLAAANIYFWVDDGWDGSEKRVETSRPFCT